MYDLDRSTEDKFIYKDVNMSRVVRKRVFGVSDHVRYKQGFKQLQKMVRGLLFIESREIILFTKTKALISCVVSRRN